MSTATFQFRLDLQSGVPVYRQIIDQVQGGIAAGTLQPGHQLPTVRQVAVDLFITNDAHLQAKHVEGIQFIVSLERAPL